MKERKNMKINKAVSGKKNPVWRRLLNPLRRVPRIAGEESGTVSVEWALISPIFITLLIGVLEFGSGALHKMQMANAVRAGLQYATVRKPIQGDITQVRDAVSITAPANATGTRAITVTLFCNCLDASPIDCDKTCASGERSSYISIGMSEEFKPILSLPFTPARHTYVTTGVVQLN